MKGRENDWKEDTEDRRGRREGQRQREGRKERGKEEMGLR